MDIEGPIEAELLLLLLLEEEEELLTLSELVLIIPLLPL